MIFLFILAIDSINP